SIDSTLIHGLNFVSISAIMNIEALTDNLQLKDAASFRASLNMKIRQYQLTGFLPEYVLDGKQTAYEFIDRLKIRRPWTEGRTYRAEALPFEVSTVIKPADGAGARGVYLIHDFNDIIDLKRARKLSSTEELVKSMKQDLESGWVVQNDWMAEELI